jgi:tetratricopeptide (TPR) repeat protein
LFLVIGGLVWTATASAAQTLSVAAAGFQEANQRYQAGDYEAAARLYEELAQGEGREAGEVYFNLGNASFKLKRLGRAILNYERARLLMPRHPMVQKNLKYAKSLVASRLDAPSNWYLARATDLLDALTRREWQILATGLLAALLALLIVHLALGRGAFAARLAFPVGVVCLLAVGCWIARLGFDASRRGAVVTSAQAEVRYGPSRQEPVAYRVSEGFLIWRLESRDGWARVSLPNREQGWVEEGSVSIV